ncbi:hypothetical protein C8R45DRAFT_1181272 [Mycena sanguinolenta]|nr:hypothetical protein C8R45DRAFT_1181272 [Mycena sanguinolenta]
MAAFLQLFSSLNALPTWWKDGGYASSGPGLILSLRSSRWCSHHGTLAVVVADGIPGIAAVGVVYADPSRDKLVHAKLFLVRLLLSVRSFYNCRAQVKQMLFSNNNLNLNRYLRLMLLAGTDICLAILLGIWVLWVNVKVCRERSGILNRDNVIRPVELDWSAGVFQARHHPSRLHLQKLHTETQLVFIFFPDASASTLTYLDVEKSLGSATLFVDLSMGIIPDYKEEADSNEPSNSDPSDSGSSCAQRYCLLFAPRHTFIAKFLQTIQPKAV